MFRTERRGPRRWSAKAGIAAVSALALTGCVGPMENGLLPTERGTTDKVDQVIDLWNGAWLSGMLVAIFVWILMIAAVVVFRRRSADEELPPQKQYNVPLEIVYTVVPLLMIGVFFFYTAKAQADIERRSDNPDVRIHAIAKQWAWDFNYTDEDVYETSQHVSLSEGRDIPNSELPTLYLPVNKQVEITLNARDVIHSFWVPGFIYKKDMIPGQTNYWTFTPQKEGEYAGKCAELCGEYHSEMLFVVKVVSQDEFDEQMQALKDKGQTGALGMDLNRLTPEQIRKSESAEGQED